MRLIENRRYWPASTWTPWPRAPAKQPPPLPLPEWRKVPQLLIEALPLSPILPEKFEEQTKVMKVREIDEGLAKLICGPAAIEFEPYQFDRSIYSTLRIYDITDRFAAPSWSRREWLRPRSE